jgi:hypothetical protein
MGKKSELSINAVNMEMRKLLQRIMWSVNPLHPRVASSHKTTGE